ncbi:general substrate transporter [Ceraceosorus guamensis]|uniref:General substrate transporter n=1 Tax=Ceraceosorus guamensis TaxID=1522189 RepID=A0A316W704_9BASI|nr:general substrate transporter [Ceraceosorus guamensis]PWN45582.1 general substrate transporter [Ceraceosorus guamensis]
MIGFAAGAGFLLFGYDQGVMGGLLTLPSFVEHFPEIDTTKRGTTATSAESTLQGLTIGLYEIGCFLGAVSCLWLGDMLGRRAIIWIGTIWMIIGAIIQAAAPNIGALIAGRIIGGVGNGMHTATIPMWQSECSPPHKRGMLVMVEGALITGGICMAYWIDFAFFWLDPDVAEGNPNAPRSTSSVAWRMPIAFQIVLCIPTLVTIWMPESPRWLLLKGREEEARSVMASLEELPLDDPEIDLKVQEIKESIEEASGAGVKDLFKQGPERNFHRTVLGFIIQMFQQISGINLITYYAATIFEQNIGMSPLVSRLVAAANGTEYFAASWVAVFTIEKFGRRKLMLFGAAGMSISMAILAAMTAPGVTGEYTVGEGPDAVTIVPRQAPGYVAAVFLFIFNTFFAIGWLGMTWLYPAEITPLSIRAAANGVSTSANWLFNFLVVLITPIAFDSIAYKTYLIFMCTNFAIFVTTFLIFPETKSRSLEEMDAIFAKSSYINPYDVVLQEQKTARRYDEHGRPVALDSILAEAGQVNESAEKKYGNQDLTRDASGSESH